MNLRTAEPASNRLLAMLPSKERRQFIASCELVDLGFAEVLAESGARIRDVWFPIGSFISLIQPIDVQASLEVGLVGDEGMVGVSVLLGVDVSPLKAMVQGRGPALRMQVPQFRQALASSGALRDALQRYVYVTLRQLALTAACTRFHMLEPRLARWLLMTQDRAHSDGFRVTQEFLAGMLGVRRVGVTKAAMSLQNGGLIEYHRGDITVLDRAGLEAASCGCYAVDRAIYARTMGPARARRWKVRTV